MKNIIKQVTFLISILFLLILIISFGYYYQYGDDFIFLNLLNEKNIIQAIIDKYLNWDGRHLSFGGIMQMVGFAYLGPTLSLFLGLASLSFSIWLLLKTLILKFEFKDFISVLVLFLIGLFPFYKDVLFWQTGIIYLYFFLQSVLIIFLYKNEFHYRKIIWLYIFVFLLAFNSQNFNLAVLTYIWLYDFFKSKWSFFDEKRIVFSLLIILGTIIMSIAPGNFIRIENGSDSAPQLSNILELVTIYFKAFNYCKYLLLLGIFGGILYGSRLKPYFHQEFWPFLAAGIISLTPFLLYPDLARIRVFFLLGAFLFFSGYVLGGLTKLDFIKSSGIFLAPLGISFGLWILFNQLLLLKDHSFQIKKRHEYLLKNSGSMSVEVEWIKRDYDLFIIRSPDYSKEWTTDFNNHYNIENIIHK